MPTATAAPVATATILIVEDDPGIAELERSRLDEAGYQVQLAPTAEEALRAIGQGGVDLVLLDYRLPGGVDGLEFYARVKAVGLDLPVILVTGFGNEATVIQALRVGVRDFVTKSMEYLDYLPEAVDRVLRQVGTERKLAESEARLVGVIGSAKDAVIVVEADLTVSLFNPAAERMFGRSAGSAHGRPLADFIPLDGDEPARAVARNAPPPNLKLRLGGVGIRAGWEEFPLEATLSTGRAGGRRFHVVVVRDVTDRKRSEDALRRSEAMLRRAEGMAHVAGWTLDVSGAVFSSSDEGRRIYGLTPPGPHALADLLARVHPDDSRRVKAAMRGAGRGVPFEIEHRLHGGEVVWVNVRAEPETDADGRVTRVIGVTQDVTARRRLEEQFRQSQKMEAFGQLAGGIAHDFNNVLTVINGYTELALGGLPEDHPARGMLNEVAAAGGRAAALTSQLLAFGRWAVLEPQVVDPNATVREMANMLRRLIGENVVMTVDLGEAVSRVRVDPGQLGQVLMNLAVNARDAMPRGGRLTLSTRDAERTPDDLGPHPGVAAGRYVQLAVTDTGCGMTDEVKARIFEPFFTTKGPGKGTGLGLATVYGIIQQSGGHLEVDSAVGAGTTFRVYLPVVEGAVAQTETAPTPRGGTETVLLVEDQPEVRRVARIALEASGYVVIQAGDAAEALRLTAGRPAADILVTDVMMPGMNGRELADAYRLRHPEVRVLFTSGYTADALTDAPLGPHTAFLQKPYSPFGLADKVREVLDG